MPKLLQRNIEIENRYARDFLKNDEILIATNGCFDLLHYGHVYFLNKIKEIVSGSGLKFHLSVGLNSDESVRRLKGPNRPIIDQITRMNMLYSLKAVNSVWIFNEEDCSEFLDKSKPTFYFKAGNYSLDTLNKKELAVLEKHNTQIRFIPCLEGFSTTKLIDKIKNLS